MKTTILLTLLSLSTALAAAPDGEALYKERCGICHDGKVQARTPARDEIASRTPEFVYKAMFEGAMMAQSAGLSAEEGRAIARYLTGKEFSASVTTNVARCPGNPPAIQITTAPGTVGATTSVTRAISRNPA
jgi:cytochrome c553